MTDQTPYQTRLYDRLERIAESARLNSEHVSDEPDTFLRERRAGTVRANAYMLEKTGDETAWGQAKVDRMLEMITNDARAHNTSGAAWLLNQAENALREAVELDRENGASWDDIAAQLGCSRQAAQQRFGARR